MHSGLEIERKYLIRMPDEAALAGKRGCEVWEIVQTYLKDSGNGYTNRLRRVRANGREMFIRTVKQRVSAMSSEESEYEISEAEYARLMQDADPQLKSISKRRYRIPHEGQLLEIDIYSFWNDRATLEIELSSEDEAVHIPDWLHILREVTGETAYKNLYLAREVPMEKIE